jgi:glutamate-1-semialdehyde aminotransferase
MMDSGIYLAARRNMRLHFSRTTHTEEDVQQTIAAAREAFVAA